MGYAERNIWVQLVVSGAGTVVYLAIVLPQLWQRPVDDIDWMWPMTWTILAVIALTILLSIGWGIFAGLRDPGEGHAADQRDREIEWFGDRVGQAFATVGGLAALVLAMLEAHWFWIGNVLFLGFFLTAAFSGIARLRAYRRGFPQ